MKYGTPLPGGVTDRTDGPEDVVHPGEPVDDTPTVTCTTCGREWSLDYELDELRVGNQAVEQFALDHMRHAGHFPDDVSTWRADCRHCPEVEERLGERPARRWAQTHARHTGHEVLIRGGTDGPAVVSRGEGEGSSASGDGDAAAGALESRADGDGDGDDDAD
jgi:hypothetical protein